MAKAMVIKGLVQHCQTYDAASFEGLVLPSLVPRSENFQRGELVIYIEKPRFTWKGRYFAGKVVRPSDLWLTDVHEGDEFPLDIQVRQLAATFRVGVEIERLYKCQWLSVVTANYLDLVSELYK